MEREEIEFALKISALRDRGWFYDILENLIKLDESEDIRELNELHDKINTDLTELTIERIKGIVLRASHEAKSVFSNASVRAQGGT